MLRPPAQFARWWRPLLGAAALTLAGCTDRDRARSATELDEPAFREGQDLLKNGRWQEALSAYLRVINKRGEDAPQSHLSAGLIYAEHIKDPLSAIYHFRKYLALLPNGPLTLQVRQRIDAATREFARTLPAQPLENQLQRVDLVAALDRLKQENESLKQELADLKAGRNTVAVPGLEGSAPPNTTAPAINFSVETMPTVRTRPVNAPPAPRKTTSTPPRITPASQAPAAARPAAAGSRTHTVQAGDTLSKLAQQYYGNRAKWRDIYAANRGVMKSESDLKLGMSLKIP